jgi:N-acetylglucosaminyldiphosphoundecaprenol N-acetyl-beta-D-mannosaminyltransferase
VTIGKAEKSKTGYREFLFGLPLDLETSEASVLERIQAGNFLLTYLNPYSYTVVSKYAGYEELLHNFDCVVCDGVGVQIAAKTVFGVSTPILSLDYSGIGRSYLQLASHTNMSLCLVGGQTDTVQKAAQRIGTEFPGIMTIDAFRGFGNGPKEAEEYILSKDTQMVLAGLGMGMQERFVQGLVQSGWRGVGLCVGGFFDKLADPQLEYQPWAERIKMRFLGRLVREPRRLSRRYFIDYQRFIKLYCKYLITRKRDN